jgi:hypothetical protein
MVTGVPAGARSGEMLEIPGVTLKVVVLLVMPATETLTLAEPAAAVAGTVKAIAVALQFTGVTAVPLNTRLLLPCELPKFVPLMVTADRTGP